MTVKISTGCRLSILNDLKTALTDAVVRVYSGSQPTSADADEGSGDLLAEITLDGGAFTGGVATNGLDWGTVAHESSGSVKILSYLPKDSNTWKGTALEDGTLGWARIYANAYTTGASEVAVRIDGSISTATGADFVATKSSVVTGEEVVITQCNLRLPYI